MLNIDQGGIKKVFGMTFLIDHVSKMEHLETIPEGNNDLRFWEKRFDLKMKWAFANLNEQALAEKKEKVEREIEEEKNTVNRYISDFLEPYLENKECDSWRFKYTLYGPNLYIFSEELREVAIQLIMNKFARRNWSVLYTTHIEQENPMVGDSRKCIATVHFKK